jgi:transposase
MWAWVFFGRVFAVVIPDTMKAIVERADAIEPRLNDTFREYAQARGFAVEPARVRSPLDKPAVDQYVRSNFFAGEHFRDLDDYRVVMARRLSQQRFQSDRSLLWIWMKRLLLAVAVSWRDRKMVWKGVLERS